MSKITIPDVRVFFEHSEIMDSMDDAEDLFVIAKDRLLAINNWNTHNPSIRVELLDRKGHPIHRSAHFHDVIKVSDDQVPTTRLSIEHLVYDDFPDTSTELFSMELLPVTANGSQVTIGDRVFIIIERHTNTVVCGIAKHAASDATVPAYGINWKLFLEDLLLI